MIENIAIGGWFPLVGVEPARADGFIIPYEDSYHQSLFFLPGSPPKIRAGITSIPTEHDCYIPVAQDSTALTAQCEGYTYTVGITFSAYDTQHLHEWLQRIEAGCILLLFRAANNNTQLLNCYHVFHPLKPPQVSYTPAPESPSTPSQLLQVSLQGVDIVPYRRGMAMSATYLWRKWYNAKSKE